MRTLFVLNGGAAVKPGNKSAYLSFDDPIAAFKKGGINTGDVLVYDATLKALAYDEVKNLQFSRAADPKLWPQQAPEATVIRGSNYLSEALDLGHLVPLLEKLPGPIVAIGVGAQAAQYKRLKLSKGTVRAWKAIGEKSHSIGVRGVYSAEVLNDHGIKNVRVIGCPSFYRSLRPSIAIKRPNPATARVGLTLNKYLSADYASNAIKTNRTQRALIREIAKRPSSRLYSQGEQEETLAIFAQDGERQTHVQAILAKFDLLNEPEAQEFLSRRMVAFFDVDEWAQDAAKHIDAMVGFRLHGNVIALQQGLPGILFTYDSRTRELASLFAVPSVEVEEYLPINIEALLANADFSRTEHVYRQNYAEYHRFLTENKLRHVLNAPVAPVLDRPSSTPNVIHVLHDRDSLVSWFNSEVDFLTADLSALRTRAWNLELSLREARKAQASSRSEKQSA